MSRHGVDRVLRYAFGGRSPKHLTSAAKSNGVAITMPYWTSVARPNAIPDVRVDKFPYRRP